jgi:3-deoxy-D-manno-octulosonic acid hydroxylase-like protein
MTAVINIPIMDWNQQCLTAAQEHALHALEEGNVLFFPQLGFSIGETEAQFLNPSTTLANSKNISLDVGPGKLGGTGLDDVTAQPLHAMMQRFAKCSNDLMLNLLPHYKTDLIQDRTSFRPVEVAGRTTSWRKDDTRLHVDSFPSSPVQDRRILRVFCNINPHRRSRSWRLGEPFESVAKRYLPFIPNPIWGSSQLLSLFRVTKSRRSAYDHFMLQLHDRMKADFQYQSEVNQSTYDFPAGSTWMTFTDQVSHAAMTGQYLLEQTYYLPVASMMDQSKSPLRILERLAGQKMT